MRWRNWEGSRLLTSFHTTMRGRANARFGAGGKGDREVPGRLWCFAASGHVEQCSDLFYRKALAVTAGVEELRDGVKEGLRGSMGMHVSMEELFIRNVVPVVGLGVFHILVDDVA